MKEEFQVSFGTGHTTGAVAAHRKATGFGGSTNTVDGSPVERRIADDAASAHSASFQFELRFYEQKKIAPRSGKGNESRENLGEANKGEIGANELRRFGDVGRQQESGVFFDGEDARVLAQLPGELAGGDVHSIDANRAALQEAISKASGRTADIETDEAGQINAEIIECTGQLRAGTAGVCGFAPGEFERSVNHHKAAGLGLRGAGDADASGENESLGALAGFCEAAFDEQAVQPAFLDFGPVPKFRHSGSTFAFSHQARRATR